MADYEEVMADIAESHGKDSLANILRDYPEELNSIIENGVWVVLLHVDPLKHYIEVYATRQLALGAACKRLNEIVVNAITDFDIDMDDFPEYRDWQNRDGSEEKLRYLNGLMVDITGYDILVDIKEIRIFKF